MSDRIKYASKGEVVTCESGHKIARFNQDVYTDESASSNVLDWCFETRKPQDGDKLKPCKCGEKYVANNIHGGIIVHVDGNWRRK